MARVFKDESGHWRWPSESHGMHPNHRGCFADGMDDEPDPPLPAKRTQHPPGSQARVEEMAARARRGEAIFHPLDDVDFESWFKRNTQPPQFLTISYRNNKTQKNSPRQKPLDGDGRR